MVAPRDAARGPLGPVAGADPLSAAVRAPAVAARHHNRSNAGSWLAVMMIIAGFAVGCFALALHSVVLWVLTGAALVVGGIIAMASRIMDQAY